MGDVLPAERTPAGRAGVCCRPPVISDVRRTPRPEVSIAYEEAPRKANVHAADTGILPSPAARSG